MAKRLRKARRRGRLVLNLGANPKRRRRRSVLRLNPIANKPKRKRAKRSRAGSTRRKTSVRRRRTARRNVRRRRPARRRMLVLRNVRRRRPAWRRVVRRNPLRRGRRQRPRRNMSLRRRSRRHMYRRNPAETLKSMIKPALAGAAGFMLARLLGNLTGTLSFVPAALRPHAQIVGNVAAIAAAVLVPPRVSALRPYHGPLVMGSLVSLVVNLIDRFMPPSAAPYLGSVAATPLGAGGIDQNVMNAAMSGLYGYAPQASAEGIGADWDMGEYVREPLGEYISEGGPVTEALAEYVDEPLNDDGSIDAGVVSEGGSLYGDPSLEMLDDVEFLSGNGGAATPFRPVMPTLTRPVAAPVMGAPQPVVAIPMAQQRGPSGYGVSAGAGTVGGVFHNHVLHGYR